MKFENLVDFQLVGPLKVRFHQNSVLHIFVQYFFKSSVECALRDLFGSQYGLTGRIRTPCILSPVLCYALY